VHSYLVFQCVLQTRRGAVTSSTRVCFLKILYTLSNPRFLRENENYVLSLVCVLLQCYRSIRVGVLAVLGVVEAAATTAPCSRHRRRHTNSRHRGQETWTICHAVAAVYLGLAEAPRLDTDIRRGPNLQILAQLYITPRPVSRLPLKYLGGYLKVCVSRAKCSHDLYKTMFFLTGREVAAI
jgi:hypothetical protein